MNTRIKILISTFYKTVMTLVMVGLFLIMISPVVEAAIVEAMFTYELPTERVDGTSLSSDEIKSLVIDYSNGGIVGQHVIFIEDVTLTQSTFKFDSPSGDRVIQFEVFVEDTDGLRSDPVLIEKNVKVVNSKPNKIRIFIIELMQ